MKLIFKISAIILAPFLIGIILTDSEADFSYGSTSDRNPDHIQGPFTGGFGEETCRSCHFDYDLNMEGGSLTVVGVSESFEPEKNYEITVTVESEQLEVGGFQITARFEDGTQAGSFAWEGDRLMFTPSVSDDIQYLQHTRKGTEPTYERETSWTFTWNAPEQSGQSIILNIAANAGNYDDSSFGDWIYAKEFILKPVH